MLTFLRKIKNLSFKKFGAKEAALVFINKKLNTLGKERKFGRLTDLGLDRKAKTISLELSRDKKINTLTIKNYRIVLFKGKSCLDWDAVDCRGPDRNEYRRILNDAGRIELPRKYKTLLEVIL